MTEEVRTSLPASTVFLVVGILAAAWLSWQVGEAATALSVNVSAPDCEVSAPVQECLLRAENSLQVRDYVQGLQALDLANILSPKQPCEHVLIAIHRLSILTANANFLAMLDVIDSTIASGFIPASEIPDWHALKGAAKLQAKESGQAKDRATKKRLKLTDQERDALQWYLFRTSEYSFTPYAGFKGAMVGVLASLATASPDNVKTAESYLRSRQWEKLAHYVLKTRGGTGYDIDYYYLAAAAYGLNMEEPARKYAATAIDIANSGGTRNCLERQVSNGSQRISYCGGHRVASEAKQIIAALDQAAADRARRAAELERQKQEEAEKAEVAARLAAERERAAAAAAAAHQARRRSLAASYPADWIDDILAGRVKLGMTTAAVKEARGDPGRVEQIPPQEMWHYGSERIIFTNDVVTFIDG